MNFLQKSCLILLTAKLLGKKKMRITSDIFYPFLYLQLICRNTRIFFDEKLWIDLVESDFAFAMKNHMMDMISLRAQST